MRLGMVFRITDIIRFENAVIIATANPITIAGFNCDVTASAEQIPRICTRIGLSSLKGFLKTSLFFLKTNHSYIASSNIFVI